MLLAWIDLTASPLAVVPIATVSGAEDLILSPDGNFVAYTQAGAVHLLDLTGKAVGTIPNAVQPYWGVVYAPPTPTPTPTPIGTCRVLTDAGTQFGENGVRFIYQDADLLAQEVANKAFAVTAIPPGSELTVYYRQNTGSNLVWVSYTNPSGVDFYGWLDSSQGVHAVVGSDCGMLGGPPPTLTPTATLTPIGFVASPTPTPTATFTPIGNQVQDLINELASYGITVYPEGLPTTQPDPKWHWMLDKKQSWTIAELGAVLEGVRKTAGALYSMSTGIPPFEGIGSTSAAKAKFLQIMGNLYTLRVQNGFRFTEPPQGNNPEDDSCVGTTSQGCTNNGFDAIAFYGGVLITEYTVTHELGHRFDDRSGGQRSKDSLFGRLDRSVVELDCGPTGDGRDKQDLFGLRRNGWERGLRGWGTPRINNGFSDFQQNPFDASEFASQIDRNTEISEAVADMFLNWVYRRLTNGPAIWSRCDGPIGDSWQGFRNIEGTGRADPSEPGNSRYWWMEKETADIYRIRGW